MSKQTSPVVKTMKVTPIIAEKWMGKNSDNRHLRPERVLQYSQAMTAGDWTFGVDAIAFNGRGKLVNGQHRLAAIIMSGTSQEMLVMEGLPTSAKLHMDIGLKRQLSDYLQMEMGEKSTSTLAAILGFVSRWSSESDGVEGGRGHPRVDEMLTLFNADKEGYREATLIAGRTSNTPYLVPRIRGGLYYIFARSDAESADEFFSQLNSGANLLEGSPVLILRNTLTAQQGKQARLKSNWRVAVTIKAWNAFQGGDSIQRLSFHGGETMPVPR